MTRGARGVSRLLILAALLVPSPARGVEQGELGMTLEGGGLDFDGKLGELFSPDLVYGIGFAQGFSDIFAMVSDFLYSAHEQRDREKYGELSLTQGQFSLGLRAARTFRHFMPYLEAAPTVTFLSYRARYGAGDTAGEDRLNSHAFGVTALAGLDVFLADDLCLGLAGRVSILSTDMEFATGADVANKIEAYTIYMVMARMTLFY